MFYLAFSPAKTKMSSDLFNLFILGNSYIGVRFKPNDIIFIPNINRELLNSNLLRWTFKAAI